MKKMIFAVVMTVGLMTGSALYAQQQKSDKSQKERPTVEQMAKKQTDRMTETLKLTEAQAAKVYEVNLQEIKAMEAQREQMRTARLAEAEKMKSILSTEQFVQWSQMQQGPRQQGNQPGKPGQMMKGKQHRGNNAGACCKKYSCDKPCPKKDKE